MKKNPNKRLGLIGWIKARIMERKLRRRWNSDPEFRSRVRSHVAKVVSEHEFKTAAKPKFNKGTE